MLSADTRSRQWQRTLLLAGVVGLGIAAIVGSGGGVEGADCSFFSNHCTPTFGPIEFPSPILAAVVRPQRTTAQVGTTVTFTVQTYGIDNPSYQWRRSSDGGLTNVDIPGATGPTYTLEGVNLADDATAFVVEVGSNGSDALAQAVGHLAVSSMPGVLIEDAEFAAADWAVFAVSAPVADGPTHSEAQSLGGGNPGAYRTMAHTMPQGPSSLQVMHTSLAHSYDPAAQGAIYLIDYAEDCIALSNSTSTYLVDSRLLVEQAGRRYAATGFGYCTVASWTALALQSSLAAQDFVLVSGPACGVGESCPDFSASAAPLRFGFIRGSGATAGVAGVIVHGIDNWKVTVWRH